MFDLLEKLFEVVAVRANPEERMRSCHKKILNTKLKPSTYVGEKDWLKFWLLTNGDVVPVKYTYDDTAAGAGVSHPTLHSAGAVSGAVMGDELSLSGGPKKLTTKQIQKLKSIYIEYKIKSLFANTSISDPFSVKVKNAQELAYYLEYGKEKWESKSKDDLLEKILEATASDIRRKHRSIKRLFPDFDAKTKGVEDKGGLRLEDQDAATWKFRIHSGTKSDVWYDAYLSFKDVKSTLEKMVKDRRFWVANKTRVDLRKLAKEFMNKADIQLFCSCPADLYWGGQYIRSLDKYDAKYSGREERPPSVRNPKKYGMVCKHLDRLLKVLPFYGSTLAKWIKDFYAKDIAKWEQESQEEFMGVARAAQAAIAKRREEPEVEEPEEPEVEPEKEEPVTAELDRAKLKKERPEEKPEEPEEEPKVEDPEEEEPKEEPEKKKLKWPKSKPKKTPQPEWKPDAGEGPEEEYF